MMTTKFLSGFATRLRSSSGLPSTSGRSASAPDFDDTELAGIGIDEAGESHQLAIVGGRHLERFGGRVPSDHHREILPLPAGSPRIAQNIRAPGGLDLVLLCK